MDTSELLKKINHLCFEAKKRQLTSEEIQGCLEDGCGGNFDDCYAVGLDQGAAELADGIIALLKEYSAPENSLGDTLSAAVDKFKENIK